MAAPATNIHSWAAPTVREIGSAADARNLPQLSIVLPVLDEAGNIGPLVDEIIDVLERRLRFEIVIVDDGSTDGSEAEINRQCHAHPNVRLVRHDRTRGQSAAIRTGVKAARAPIIAVMDGDGQNDPADLPTLYAHLHLIDGVRMVVGRRIRRQDSWVRLLSSKIANGVRGALLHDGVKDTGCGLKAFYREEFLELPAFDHMHRFLPALIQRAGGKVHAVPVHHRARRHGRSKYGIRNRLWVGITDLLGMMWLQKRRI